jgi:hypothetical protein
MALFSDRFVAFSSPRGWYGCGLRLFSSRRCRSASARVVGSCADAGTLAPIPIDNIAPVSQLVRFRRCFTFPKPFAQENRKSKACVN